jgi:LCP family protein required for cell wall assembly
LGVVPQNRQDDWTRPVPRSSPRGSEEPERTRAVPRPGAGTDRRQTWRDDDPERTRTVPRGGGYDEQYDRPDGGGYDGYADPAQSARGYYDDNGDWVPRPRGRRHDDADDRGYRPHDDGRGRGDVGGAPPARPPGQRTQPGGRPPRRRARYGFRRFMALLAFLVVAYLVTMVVVVAMVWNSVGRVDAAPDVADRPGGSAGASYLLVGTDSREQLTDDERSEFGTGVAEGSRADTVMLLHVPTLGDPSLVSLPRDSYLPIRDQGFNKLNAAHSSGGPALLVDTVEQSTGMRIDGYMEIGFGGFVGVVEEVDGVHMCLDAPVQDDKAHIDLQAGCQALTGPEALGYVRMRYSDPRGDLGRVERQRQFLAALVNRMASPATVLNPLRLHSVGTATGEAVALGEDTSMLEAGRMALAMRTVANGGGNSLTVPVADTNYATDVGSTVLWDEQGAAELFESLREGRAVTVEP